jgi:hypothetical protein
VLKGIGLLIALVVTTSLYWVMNLVTKRPSSELNLRRSSGMVIRQMIEEFLNNGYKNGISTLYINSRIREYTIGSLQLSDNMNDDLLDTIELAVAMGNDFVAGVFPNPLEDSLNLIQEIKDLKIEEDEDIMLTIPTFRSTSKTKGSTIILVFSTLFSGALLFAYDKDKKLRDSVVLETQKGIQITN